MSTSITFSTSKQLEPKQILKEQLKHGESLIVTSGEFPSLKFGTANKSLRGVEINSNDDGYEVRVCTFANEADLKLFSTVTETMMSLTSVTGYYEGDEDYPIDNPEEFFSDEWMKEQLHSSIFVHCALIRHTGHPITMYGLFMPIVFGPRLAKHFNIDLKAPDTEALTNMQEYLTQLQWVFKDKKGTSSRLVLANPNDEERGLSVSIITARDGKVEPFDIVTHADVACLMDLDGNKPVMVKFDDFYKIASHKNFTFLDELQMVCTEPLSYEDFCEMCNRAQLYQVDDIFRYFSFPGNGCEQGKKTYVLMWNPAISSVKMEDHNNNIPNLLECGCNWSINEYQEAKKGDRFVMIRCGEGKTGLVMSGIFDSNPYPDSDWSGKGRKVHYMDLRPNFIANPEKADIITTSQLQEAIPGFDWSGGHSGRLLTPEQAGQLETLIAAYLKAVDEGDKVDGKTINGFDLPARNFMEECNEEENEDAIDETEAQ